MRCSMPADVAPSLQRFAAPKNSSIFRTPPNMAFYRPCRQPRWAASKANTTFKARPEWPGKVKVFDGDNFIIFDGV
ncbi:hypothetical protein IEQ11_11145 [Lysobacter capsici]|uniref:hypothetical protein n=1 Tax=Lysobacter capsici TaxID=435897 RepID=UPI001784C7BF|nr:hypothetical protein [Lysobacter capsici]UOF17141.1 hypothetical protein IEQ11_11145 [Lysobacter capsici]